MKNLIYSALFLIFVLMFPIFGQSLAYQCASVDANRLVNKDDITIKRFNFLLNNLSKKFIENQTQIADITVMAKNKFYKLGREESLLDIMEAVNENSSFDTPKQSYANFIGAMLLLVAIF